jgi:hypothetical protein
VLAGSESPPLAGLRGPILRTALWLLPPVLVGALLRLWGLSGQILLGDEMHAVVSALNLSVPEILVTYRLADHCIPLAALYRLLIERGVELSELVIRAPPVVAGLAALVIFPLAVARWPHGGWRRAAVLAWLIAVSPSLVFYSRFARPYAMVVLLAPLAAAAFWRWWRGGGHRWAALYAACGAASAWFFLGSAPFVAAPLAWAAGDLALARLGRRREGGRRGLLALAAAAAGLAAGVAAFLLPALRTFLRLVRRKAGGVPADLGDVTYVAQLQSGALHPSLAVLFWGLALLGLALLLRRRPGLGLFTLLLVVAQWVGIVLVLRPDGITHPTAINRYVLMTLPLVLFWLAEAVVWIHGTSRTWRRTPSWAGGALAAACVGGLLLGNPFVVEPGFRLGPFGGAWQTEALPREPPAMPAAAIPGVYRLIAAEPGDEPVVEAIYPLVAHALQPVVSLAKVHGRPVILVASQRFLRDPRVAFRAALPPDPEAIERSGGRFVVLPLDRPRLRRLERAVTLGMAPPSPTSPRHETLVEARALANELIAAWGEPHLVSEDILAWDLARIR